MRTKRDTRLMLSERSRLIERLRNVDPNVAKSLADIKLDWYRIRDVADTDDDTTEVLIYEEISMWWGLTAEDFVRDLNDITTSNIKLRINSPGGSVFESIAIYNALVMHDATVNVYVDSLAASAASVIAMAGDSITMMVGSQMMIHDALGVEMGNAKELREFADFLDKQSDNIASIYANRAGGEASEWREKMLAETWLFADEAVEIGLADEVYKRPEKSEEDDKDPKKEDDPEEEETEEDDEETDEDEFVDALMHQRHRLANRGFKYPGRRKAPTPVENQFDIDKIIAAMARVK